MYSRHESWRALAHLCGSRMVAVALLICFCGTSSAQSRDALQLRRAQELVMGIRVRMDNHVDPPDYAPAAGILFGFRADTMLVATAFHVLSPPYATIDTILVQWDPGSAPLRAIAAEQDTALDLAVLKVPVPDSVRNHFQSSPRWLRSATPTQSLPTRTPVFAAGCPRGQCWGPAEDARLYAVTDTLIEFRATGIQNGFSGGALFDHYGSVVGMVINDDPPETAALRWDVAERRLQAWGYAPTLRPLRVERWGDMRLQLMVQAYPSPERNRDGRRLFPGIAVYVSRRVNDGVSLVAGLQGMSFSPIYKTDSILAYTSNFATVGFRWDWELSTSEGPLFMPMGYMSGVGVQLSYIRDLGTQVLFEGTIPDSLDLTTGEPAKHKVVADGHISGVEALLEQRIYFTRSFSAVWQISWQYISVRPGGFLGLQVIRLGVSAPL